MEEEEGMMNDFWTALGDKPGELTPFPPHSSSHNQSWQNEDICRNIGYSRRHSPAQAFLSLLYVGRPVSRPANCLWALKHLFQLALSSCPGILHLVGVIYILLLIKIHNEQGAERIKRRRRRKKQQRARNKTVASRFRAKHHQHFMKWRCDKVLSAFACVSMHIRKRRGGHKIMQGRLICLHLNAWPCAVCWGLLCAWSRKQ